MPGVFPQGTGVCLLVNNLGALTPLELMVCAKEAVACCEGTEALPVLRLLLGPFMTSLDMRGVSVTLFAATAEELELLDSGTSAPAWPHAPSRISRIPRRPVPGPARGSQLPHGASSVAAPAAWATAARAAIQAAARGLVEAEPVLTAADQKVGDGDCGLTLKAGGLAVLEELESGETKTDLLTEAWGKPQKSSSRGHAGRLPLGDVSALFAALGRAVRRSMGGSSGALLDIMFSAAAATEPGAGAPGGSIGAVATRLQAGLQAMMKYGGAKPGDRRVKPPLSLPPDSNRRRPHGSQDYAGCPGPCGRCHAAERLGSGKRGCQSGRKGHPGHEGPGGAIKLHIRGTAARDRGSRCHGGCDRL